MQQWVVEVLMPYANRSIALHRLHDSSSIILVLDVWAVHKSEEFRFFLRTHHPRIQLVFVPANCTSKLQVADVALQRPFKEAITKRFNQWAATLVQQGGVAQAVNLSPSLSMANIKPLALGWCVESWMELRDRRQLILDGWKKSCTSLYDVLDPAKRIEAVTAVAKMELDHAHVPEQKEQDAPESESDCSSDDSDSDVGGAGPALTDAESDGLDLAVPLPEPTRRSTRSRAPPRPFGYSLNSQGLHFTSDSDHA